MLWFVDYLGKCIEFIDVIELAHSSFFGMKVLSMKPHYLEIVC